jgi:hypothetical protein
MNNRLLIFLCLVLISENVFSQSDTVEFTPDFNNVEIDEDIYQELLDLEMENKLMDKQLREAEESISLLEKHAKVKDDSLRGCLNQKNEENLEIESTSLLNVGKYYALIIAVQDYKNRNFSDLKYTIRDAEALQKVLLEDYVFEDIYMCLDPTKSAIEMQFQGLQEVADSNANVLIFYAGHGYKWNKPRKNLTEGYWCPVDAEWESTSTIINNSQILYNLQVLDSRNTLLISDACFAGSIGDSRNVTPPQSDVIQEVYNIQSCQYISSGSNTTVPDESIFIKNLLKALTDNNKKYLKATDLFYNTDVQNSHTRSDGNMVIPACSPLMKAGHVKGGDFIFIKKSK